jgi:DHA1 family tetracycline resistance protein-like MFS transporter
MKSRPLLVLFCTLLLDTISIGILIPVLPAIFTDPTSPTFMLYGYSVASQYFLAGAITAVFGLMQFLAAPILGELSDVYGRKRLLTIGVAVLAFSNLLFGFGIEIASLAVLFVARILAGLAGANFSIAQAAIVDVSKPEERAKNFGIIGAAFGIGFILGPLLGGIIAATFSHAAMPFIFAGGLGILNVMFIVIFLKETRKTTNEVRAKFNIFKGLRNIQEAFRDKDALPVYLSSFFYMCGFAFFTSFIGILLAVNHGYNEAGIGGFFAAFGLCIAVTQLVILPQIAKRFKERPILLVGFPVVAAVIFTYPFIDGNLFLYVLIPFMAIPQGLAFANISSLVSKSVSPDKQGAALGINGSLMALAQGIIPLIAGVGTGVIGLTSPFVAGGLVIMLAWVILWNARRRAYQAA